MKARFLGSSSTNMPRWVVCMVACWGRSETTLTRLWLFDHLPHCVDIFYGINIDKRWTFLNHLPTSSCKSSLWMTPLCKYLFPCQLHTGCPSLKYRELLKKIPYTRHHISLLNTLTTTKERNLWKKISLKTKIWFSNGVKYTSLGI